MNNQEKLRRAKISIAQRMRSNGYNSLYIGSTSDLQKRMKRYKDLACFQVLIETSSYNFARQFEQTLIEYGRENFLNCNRSPYSVGLNPNAGHYYIYMVADYDKCPL